MNLRQKLTAAAFAVATALGAGSASASVIDFTGWGTGAGSGVSLSCDASGTRYCSVTRTYSGLGITRPHDSNPGQIDGSPVGTSETLTISFDHEVAWNNVRFGRWDHNDDATVRADGGFSTWFTHNSGLLNLDGYVSRSLTITAYGSNGDRGCRFCSYGNDNFTVASIDVEAVPLPAAGFLLLGAMGGLAALRRKQIAA